MKRGSFGHPHTAPGPSTAAGCKKILQTKGRGEGQCIDVALKVVRLPSQGVGSMAGWDKTAEETGDDNNNNAAACPKRMKIGDVTSEREAPTTSARDPVMAAMDAAGMDEGMVVDDNTGTNRVLVVFPDDCDLSLENKYIWYMALLKQYPECKPLFKEGRNAPYISLQNGQQFEMLITEGFQGQVMKPMADLRRTVIVFDVPTYISTNLLECPPGFLWLKRRMIGNTPRPQLLGAIAGKIDSEVHIIGVGRKRVAPFVPEPDLCKRCSKWGHKSWKCRAAYVCCRYCAGGHLSQECWEKIQQKIKVPPKCCNCGGQHNASSPVCPRKPRNNRSQPPNLPLMHKPVFKPAPPPTRSAWNNNHMQEEFPLTLQENTSPTAESRVDAQDRLTLALQRLSDKLDESIKEIKADQVRLEKRLMEYTECKCQEVKESLQQEVQELRQDKREIVQEEVHTAVVKDVGKLVQQEVQKLRQEFHMALENIVGRLENLEKREDERQRKTEEQSKTVERALQSLEGFKRELLDRLSGWSPPQV